MFKELLEKVIFSRCQRDQRTSGQSSLHDLGILQSPGSADFKGQTQQLNQTFSGISTTDLRSSFSQRARRELLFSLREWETPGISLTGGIPGEKGARVRPQLSGFMQAHFLALCVTLMKESGSLSQEHGRIGSKKKCIKHSEVWEEGADWFRKSAMQTERSWSVYCGRRLSRVLCCPIL